MLVAYRVVKAALIALLLALLVLVLIYESKRTAGPAASEPGFYEKARDVFLYDPYDRTVLVRVAEEKKLVRTLFSDILSSVSNLIAHPDFYNNVFIFMVSKKSDEISRLVRDEFTNLPAFEDLIILDRDESILFKYGNTSFITGNYAASKTPSAGRTNAAEVIVNGNELAVIERYRDTTLETEIRIIALFSPERIAAELREYPYPNFLVLRDRVLTNTVPVSAKNVIPLVQQDPGNDRKYYIGNSVIETVSLSARDVTVGSLGIVYPARNLGGTILVLLKVAGLVLLVLGLIALDSLLEKLILQASRNRKTRLARLRVPRAPRPPRVKNSPDGMKTADPHEAETDLDWVSKYIVGSEKQKKGEDE